MRPMFALLVGVLSAVVLCIAVGFNCLPLGVYSAMGIGFALGALCGCKEN